MNHFSGFHAERPGRLVAAGLELLDKLFAEVRRKHLGDDQDRRMDCGGTSIAAISEAARSAIGESPGRITERTFWSGPNTTPISLPRAPKRDATFLSASNTAHSSPSAPPRALSFRLMKVSR